MATLSGVMAVLRRRRNASIATVDEGVISNNSRRRIIIIPKRSPRVASLEPVRPQLVEEANAPLSPGLLDKVLHHVLQD